MAYRVEFLASARRELSKLSPEIQRRILPRIEALASDPRPHGAQALQGGERKRLRIRVGDYRVIYRIEDDVLIVVVVKVGHRREIYRD